MATKPPTSNTYPQRFWPTISILTHAMTTSTGGPLIRSVFFILPYFRHVCVGETVKPLGRGQVRWVSSTPFFEYSVVGVSKTSVALHPPFNHHFSRLNHHFEGIPNSQKHRFWVKVGCFKSWCLNWRWPTLCCQKKWWGPFNLTTQKPKKDSST